MASRMIEIIRIFKNNNVYIKNCLDVSLYYISVIITLILTIGAFILILMPNCNDNIFTDNLDCRLVLTGIIIYSVYGFILICGFCAYFCFRLYTCLIK